MDSHASEELDEDLVVQIASIYKCNGNTLQIHQLPVQQQIGAVDCGLFAVAFAVAACELKEAVDLTCFDQSKMRQHLHDCLENRFLDSFPRTSDVNAVSELSLAVYQLFCECKMPEFTDNMLECDVCKRWLFLKCSGFTNEFDVPEWYECKRCSN